MKPLKTINRKGEAKTFYYEIIHQEIYHGLITVPGVLIKVYTNTYKSYNYLKIELIEKDKYFKLVDITHENDQDFVAQGIPDAILPELYFKLNKQIRSSSNKKREFTNEFREICAENFWKRLVNAGKAVYNDEDDYYITI